MLCHQTYYEVLGVNQQSSAEDVKAAYQKLALSLHPDKAGSQSQPQFQLLQQAWQVGDAFLQLPNSTGWPPGLLA